MGEEVPSKRKEGRSAPVLPWMRRAVSVEELATYPVDSLGGLDQRILSHLASKGFENVFSIQKEVWEMTCGGQSKLHDVCFSAPTGSGKTLAYALPIVNALAVKSNQTYIPVQCIIVLPTRGLAMQVQSVIQPLGESVGLKSIAVCGSVSVREEANELMGTCRYSIAVFTPGRLVSHIESTHGFAERVKSTSFLVVDEADRLLRQRYNDWLSKIWSIHDGTNVLKFIVSATLTRDPSKLDALRLHAPRFVTFVQEEHKYKLPTTLEETKIVVADRDKPAALCTLLMNNLCHSKDAGCIVFVSAVETASILTRLLNCIESRYDAGIGGGNPHDTKIVEYSAATPPKDRETVLSEFRKGSCKVLVCSDAITRGIDIQGVGTVINYDAPVYAKTYVHRAGRTARAGKRGKVITLLRKEDVRHFKDMLRKADNNYVKDEVLESETLIQARHWVTEALDTMNIDNNGAEMHDVVPKATKKHCPSHRKAGTSGHYSGIPEVHIL